MHSNSQGSVRTHYSGENKNFVKRHNIDNPRVHLRNARIWYSNDPHWVTVKTTVHEVLDLFKIW